MRRRCATRDIDAVVEETAKPLDLTVIELVGLTAAAIATAAAIRANTSGQPCPAFCRNRRIVGYQGESSRSRSQRQSGTCGSAVNTGRASVDEMPDVAALELDRAEYVEMIGDSVAHAKGRMEEVMFVKYSVVTVLYLQRRHSCSLAQHQLTPKV